jgi:hypothetical protein
MNAIDTNKNCQMNAIQPAIVITLSRRARQRAGALLALLPLAGSLAAAEQCEIAPGRYTGVEIPANTAGNCNLPALNPTGTGPRSGNGLAHSHGEAIALSWSRDGVPADGQSAVDIRVELFDRDGKKIERPVTVTIETSLGRIVTPDNVFTAKSPPKFLVDRDRRVPGVQVETAGGVAEFTLLAPYEPGDAIIRVTSGDIDVSGELSFIPDLRPAVAAGIVEAQVNVGRESRDANTPAIVDDGLESELSTLATETRSSGITSIDGRAAFFYKGVLGKEWLLTTAYDSDKDRIRLFRDIQPDQFYPIYGDSSLRGFDAQSTRRGYLRLDRNKSFVLFGDFNTEGRSDESRNLGLYQRSLTGGRGHYEHGDFEFDLWGAEDTVRQVIDEQPGRGVSGPYQVSNSGGLTNSERVEIVVRDRSQPSVVLSITPLQRFADYEFEPFSGRLLLRKPVPSLDENLNPVSIRVTYEVDEGGPAFMVAGAQARWQLTSGLQIGASYADSDDPTQPYALGSANASWKLSKNTVWFAEAARSDRGQSLVQAQSEGHGFRTELRSLTERHDLRVFYGRTTEDFDNPAAMLNGGRREAGGKWTWRLTTNTDLVAEALQSSDAAVGADRNGASLVLGHWFNKWLRLEGGLRYFDDEVTTATTLPRTTYSSVYNLVPPGSIGAGSFVNGAAPASGENTMARLKLTVKPHEKSSLYAEAEQGLDDSSAEAWAIGGDYQIAELARLYARHEYANSVASLYGLNAGEERTATILGIDSNYMRDGSIFNEYRLRDAISGRDAEAAVGLRNLWPLRAGLAVSTAFEQVRVMDGQGGDATAVALGLESTGREGSKGSARFEFRTDAAADSWLSTLAYTRKLSRDWSLLGRNLYNQTSYEDLSLGKLTRNRGIIGLAYRQTDTNLWNALMRYELKLEKDSGVADPFDRDVHIVSAHVNWHPNRPLTVSGQLAGKWVEESFGAVNDNFEAALLGGRIMYDLTERWDLGFAGNVLFSGGSRRYALGIETGVSVIDNLWLSLGYNLRGFTDEDLLDSDFTRRGVYLRLRFKFDEKLFRGKQADWNNTLTPGTAGGSVRSY